MGEHLPGDSVKRKIVKIKIAHRWVSTYLVTLCWLAPLACLIPSLFKAYGKVITIYYYLVFVSHDSQAAQEWGWLDLEVMINVSNSTCEPAPHVVCTSAAGW